MRLAKLVGRCVLLLVLTLSAVQTAPIEAIAVSPPSFTEYAASITRLSGSGYAGTAAALSRRGWPKGCRVAVIVPDSDPIYGALAGPLASSLFAPVLSANRTLPKATSRELKRLRVKRAYAVGPVTSSVVRSLRSKGISVTRYKGKNSYDTGRLVGLKVRALSGGKLVVVAPRKSVSQALAASVEASRLKVPLVLTSGRYLPAASRSLVAKLKPTSAIVAGAKTYVPDTILVQLASLKAAPERVSGAGAVSISISLVERARLRHLPLSKLVVIGSSGLGNAAGAAALAARTNARVVLTNSKTASSASKAYLGSHRSLVRSLYVCGPKSAVSSSAANALRSATTTRISTKAEVLTTAERSSIATVTDTSITFATRPKGIAIGDTIVTGPTSKAPHGLLRKVTGLTSGPNGVVLQTVNGSLEDVVYQGSLDISSPLRFAGTTPGGIMVGETQYMAAGVTRRISPASVDLGTRLELLLAEVVVDEDGDHWTKTDQVRLEGKYILEESLNIHGEWKWGKLKQMDVLATQTETTEFKFQSTLARAAVKYQKLLYSQECAPIQVSIVGVPVSVTPKVYVYAGLDGDVSVGVEMGVTQESSMTLGARYSGGKWSPVGDRSSKYEWIEPTATLEASVRPFADGQLAMLFYDIAGPTITAELYAKAEWTPLGDPWFELRAGVIGKIGGKIDVLGTVWYDESLDLVDYYKILAVRKKPVIPLLDLSVEPRSSEGTVTATCSPNDGTKRYTFDWGDGTLTTGSGAVASHVYQKDGSYSVRALHPSYGYSSSTAVNVTLPDPEGDAFPRFTETLVNTTVGGQIDASGNQYVVVRKLSETESELQMFELPLNTYMAGTELVGDFDAGRIAYVETPVEYADPAVYVYDLITGMRTLVCDAPGSKSDVRLRGNILVWEDGRNGGSDIYSYDLVSGIERDISQDPTHASTYPELSASRAVWLGPNFGQSGAKRMFRTYDFRTGSRLDLDCWPQGGFPESRGLAVTDDYIVWCEASLPPPPGGGVDTNPARGLMLHRISTGVTKVIAETGFFLPSMSGRRVHWIGYDGKVHIYDDASGSTYLPELTLAPARPLPPTPIGDGLLVVDTQSKVWWLSPTK